MNEKVFAARVRELRLLKDISQNDLAKYLDVNNSTISMYESGKRKPDMNTLAKLAAILNTTTDYLAGISDSSSPQTKAINEQETGLFVINEKNLPLIRLVAQLNDENRKMAEQMLKVMVENQNK